MLLHIRASQLTTMQARNWLLMAFPLEQFLAACHLRIITVFDLEPPGSQSAPIPETPYGEGALSMQSSRAIVTALKKAEDIAVVDEEAPL